MVKYHISVLGLFQSELSYTPLSNGRPVAALLLLLMLPLLPSGRALWPAGVDGPNMEAEPAGYGKLPRGEVAPQGEAEMLAGVAARSVGDD